MTAGGSPISPRESEPGPGEKHENIAFFYVHIETSN